MGEVIKTITAIERERAEQYVQFYKGIYLISEDVQPYFWNAVIILCQDRKANPKKIGIIDNHYCLRKGNQHVHIRELGYQTVFDLAKKISEEIIKNETKPVDPLEVLKMKYDIKSLKESVISINSRLGMGRIR